MNISLTKNGSKVHWGKDKCWKCKGTGQILVSERQTQSISDSEEFHETKECSKCEGIGIVPKR